MPKRLGAGKRTRLSQTPIYKLRGNITKRNFRFVPPNEAKSTDFDSQIKKNEKIHSLISSIVAKHGNTSAQAERAFKIQDKIKKFRHSVPKSAKYTFNLKNPTELKRFLSLIELEGYHTTQPDIKSLIQIAKETKPFFRKGHLVFEADFSKYPALQHSPGHILLGIVIIDANIPTKLKNTIIDHEIREHILDNAKYKQLILGKRELDRSHLIAVQRETRDLIRKGLMQDFLEWLKANYPKAYLQRAKSYGQNRKQ